MADPDFASPATLRKAASGECAYLLAWTVDRDLGEGDRDVEGLEKIGVRRGDGRRIAALNGSEEAVEIAAGSGGAG